MIGVDFVTVAYRNDSQLLTSLIHELLAGSTLAGYEPRVHIVLNDESHMEPPSEACTVHAGQGNVGFAAGIKVGVQAGSAEYIVVVNPDCAVTKETVAAFLKNLSPVGVTVPRLLREDGTFDYFAYENWTFTIGRKLSEWLCGKYLSTQLSGELPRYAKAPGAFLGMPRDVAEKLASPFDTAYLLYAEDRDMSDRARKSGIPLQLVPVDIPHIGGVSGRGISNFIEYCKSDGSLRVAYRRLGRMGAAAYALDLRTVHVLKRSRDRDGAKRAVRRWSQSGFSDPGRIRDEELAWTA